jgi:3-oxoacyl-[acyl-carrier-protein] synthase II
VANTAIGHLSIHHGITGPGIAVVTGTAAGLQALEMALLQLDSGRIDRALVGGIDTLTDLYHQAMSDLRVLARGDRSPAEGAPLAEERSGIVPSEGAVFLALESRASCLGHGAKPLAEVVSAASVSDGFSFYGNDPEGRGFQRAMELCLARAGVPRDQVDLVLAAASGQSILDRAEWRGIEKTWQEAKPTVPVTAIKGVTGEMGAATALLGVAIATRVFAREVIPPVVPSRPLDPECGLAVIRHQPLRRQVRYALVNEASWGGVNVTALLRRAEAAP